MRSKIFWFSLVLPSLVASPVLRCAISPDQSIADSLNQLAVSLQARGLYAEAEADLQRALAIRQAAYEPGSIQVAAALSDLGAVEQELGHVDQATLHQQAAFATAERLLAPDDPALVPYLVNEAAVERASKKYDAAEAHLTKALAIAEGHRQGRQQAQVWTSLGELYGYQARSDKADEAYNRALSSYGAGTSADRLEMVRLLNNLAASKTFRHFYPAATGYAMRAIDLCAAIPQDSLVCGLTWNTMASIEISQGKNVSAEAHARRALIELSDTAGPKSRLIAAAENNLGQAYAGQARFKEAEETLTNAAEKFQALGGDGDADYASSIGNLGALYISQHKYKKAEPLYRRAAEIDRVALGDQNPKFAQDLNRLGVLLFAGNRKTEAEASFRRALEIEVKVLGEESPLAAEPCINLAALLQSERRRAESLEYYQRGLKLMQSGSGGNTAQMASVLENYSGLLKEMQLWAEAEKASAEAMGLRVQRTIHPDSFE